MEVEGGSLDAVPAGGLAVGGGGHLHGDVFEVSPPSGGVLLGLESGMGRGTGRATGGGGGSRKEPGILLWPLPLGCRRHTGQGVRGRRLQDTG